MRAQIGFLEVIRENVPGALLVGDSTQPVYAGNLGFAAATPGSWFNSATGFGSLGYALPASTGASLGAPGRPVVCLVGDGGLQFTLGELGVPRDVEAWVAIVVWNNRSYSEIRTSMVAAGIEPSGVEVVPPDFALLARATHYTETAGRPLLRAAIARSHAARTGQAVTAENVIFLGGAQNGLFVASLLLAGPGDEIIAIDPMYVTYPATIQASGATLVPAPAPAAANFHPDLAALEAAVTPRTRANLI